MSTPTLRVPTGSPRIRPLTALAAELTRRGTSAEMYVVGGAAIRLAFDERRSTRDIDS